MLLHDPTLLERQIDCCHSYTCIEPHPHIEATPLHVEKMAGRLLLSNSRPAATSALWWRTPSCYLLRHAFTATPPPKRPDSYRIGMTRSWDTVSAVMPTGGAYDPGDLFADACIRNLIRGVFPSHKYLVIRKKENTITISFYIKFKGLRRHPPAIYFLTGFVETLLTHWLGARVYVDVRGEPNIDKQLHVISHNKY